MSQSKQRKPEQLELQFGAPAVAPAPVERTVARPPEVARSGLRVIQGGGQKAPPERIDNRNAVVRVLVETGADLLLRRISSVRAEAIERDVNRILRLFDRVDASPELMPVLRRELDGLEALMAQTRAQRAVRSNG